MPYGVKTGYLDWLAWWASVMMPAAPGTGSLATGPWLLLQVIVSTTTEGVRAARLVCIRHLGVSLTRGRGFVRAVEVDHRFPDAAGVCARRRYLVDGGVLDGDSVYDRAVGPFQFIPTSWTRFGVDGDGDGIRNPHDVDDAVPAMVRHLCPNGQITNLKAAVFSYNRGQDYVDLVLSWASRYGTV